MKDGVIQRRFAGLRGAVRTSCFIHTLTKLSREDTCLPHTPIPRTHSTKKQCSVAPPKTRDTSQPLTSRAGARPRHRRWRVPTGRFSPISPMALMVCSSPISTRAQPLVCWRRAASTVLDPTPSQKIERMRSPASVRNIPGSDSPASVKPIYRPRLCCYLGRELEEECIYESWR